MEITADRLAVRRNGFLLDVPRFTAGERGIALMGPNGSGKTTFLLALQGLLAYDGVVTRNGRCAGVFSQPAFLRGSVRWNVTVALRSVRGIDEHAARSIADQLLQSVELGEVAGQDARRLSSGQRQRLALARALALEPEALFLDEPFANVDAGGRAALRLLVREYVARTRCVLLIATQTLADAAALTVETALLDHGRIVETLATQALRSARHPYVHALFADAAV